MSTSTRVAALLVLVLVLTGCERASPELEDAAPAPEPPAGESGEDRDAPEGTGGREDDDAAPADDGGGPEEEATGAAEAPPATVEPFDDPQELADALASAETALAEGGLPPRAHARWTAVHQQAYRDLAANPQWREAARSAVPPELHDAYDLTVHATEELRRLTEPAERLPEQWRIEAPPPVDELRGHYEAAEAEFGVPWSVLAAIHLIETRFGRIHGDSTAGAQGPMQFMPSTWEAYGRGDVDDPRDAIMAAGRYLAANGAPDDLRGALFAYNRSDHYVKAVLAHAEAMELHDHYLDVYHGWQVYYRTVDGDVLLEEGYGS